MGKGSGKREFSRGGVREPLGSREAKRSGDDVRLSLPALNNKIVRFLALSEQDGFILRALKNYVILDAVEIHRRFFSSTSKEEE